MAATPSKGGVLWQNPPSSDRPAAGGAPLRPFVAPLRSGPLRDPFRGHALKNVRLNSVVYETVALLVASKQNAFLDVRQIAPASDKKSFYKRFFDD